LGTPPLVGFGRICTGNPEGYQISFGDSVKADSMARLFDFLLFRQ